MKLLDVIDTATQFVDVRTTAEYAEGHLDGALNIPLEDVMRRKGEIKGLGSQPVVFYCRSGNRSELAVTELRKEHYEHLYNGGSLEDVRRLVKQMNDRSNNPT